MLEPQTPDRQESGPAPAKPIKIRRLRALFSYGRLRGQGIKLSDILLVASVLDIDTRK